MNSRAQIAAYVRTVFFVVLSTDTTMFRVKPAKNAPVVAPVENRVDNASTKRSSFDSGTYLNVNVGCTDGVTFGSA